ncbi:hypothetical protein N7510_001697 [Penicillium lagena]|uniref:uncharacterized protein n=1 Tax=Penicillium lagena TaxID=94218 RepID=UPI00254229EC|nr:uncharacterized protein N7510_001697 [Penicillium lagena]KAJ5625388.1 hypothetical protein N7510_001697 [Penicillium lagena]
MFVLPLHAGPLGCHSAHCRPEWTPRTVHIPRSLGLPIETVPVSPGTSNHLMAIFWFVPASGQIIAVPRIGRRTTAQLAGHG